MGYKNADAFGPVHIQWHSNEATPPAGEDTGAPAPETTDAHVGPTWLPMRLRSEFADMKVPAELADALIDSRAEVAKLSQGRTLVDDYGALEIQYPEGYEAPEKDVVQLRDAAKAAGLSQEQTNALAAFEAKVMSDRAAATNAEYDTTSKALAEKYGDSWEAEMKAADKVADKLGLKKYIFNMGLQNNLEIIETMISIKDRLSEDALGPVSSPGVAGKREPGEVMFPESEKHWNQNR